METNSPATTFNRLEFLSNAFYYPAAGDDLQALPLFASRYQHFILVDYSKPAREINYAMQHQLQPHGYDCIQLELLGPEVLSPNYRGPQSMKPNTHELERLERDFIRERYLGRGFEPYAYWATYRKRDQVGDTATADNDQLQLLFVGGEVCATLEALYHQTQKLPAGILIKNPGEGYGDNWTLFTDESFRFYQIIKGLHAEASKKQEANMPVLYVFDSIGEGRMEACWQKYQYHSELRVQDERYFPFVCLQENRKHVAATIGLQH